MKLETRKRKYSSRKILSFSCVRPYFIYPFAAPKEVWRLVWNILHNFFFLQWRQKFHISKRPIINVNTDLDDKIPFTPSYIKIYLGFVPYFICPLDYLYKRLGLRKCLPYANRSIRYIKYLYKNASDIYKFCMSTTPRPRYLKSHKFMTIHLWDPHYLCVPSLHVAISAGLYTWYKNLFNEMKEKNLITEEECKLHTQEYRKKGIEIIESVLFVKQHSVNCIPTALYLVTKTMALFDFQPDDYHTYINDIFNSTPEVSADVKEEIQKYFVNIYDELLHDSDADIDWRMPIKNWLVSYAQTTGQSISM